MSFRFNLFSFAVAAAMTVFFLPVCACSCSDGSTGEPEEGETPQQPEDPEVPEDEGLSQTAYAVAEKLGMGWNLGNQMDSYVDGISSETAWGNPAATQATFDGVRAAGFKSVRIPVTWLGHIGPAPEYHISEDWMDRVAELVGYAEAAGLNAIVNRHHDGADSMHWLNIREAAQDRDRNTRIKEQISAMWTQIASRFKDKGDFLIFEAFNEIHDGGWGWGDNRTDGGRQYSCLAEWNQTFVDAVRATGGKNADRYLAVPGYCTNPELTVGHLVLPDDTVSDRLLVSVHYYDPTEYTLTAAYPEWGHTAQPGKSAGDNEEARVTDVFSALNEAFISRGIPVYIGEMGCVNRDSQREQAFQRYWFEYVVKAARTYGMSAFVWDNGAKGTGNEQHGFIDHASGEYMSAPAEEAVKTMIRAMETDDESYVLETVYDNAPDNLNE